MKKNFNYYQIAVHICITIILAVFNIVGIGWLEHQYSQTVSKTNSILQSNMIQKEFLLEVPVMEILERTSQRVQEPDVQKIAYLTFDDGPSENTDKILDVLKEKGVKATFFVVGKTGEKARERYRRIVEEGHTLGLHSYSHRYEEIYGSLENFKSDVLKLKEYLYQITGEDVWVYRFPGGSSNSVAKISIKECIDFLDEEGIVYFDWNASSEDAVEVNASCSVLNSNILRDALRYERPVILMHDLYECCNTADGLEMLIDRLLKEGYQIEEITKSTKPVQHVN